MIFHLAFIISYLFYCYIFFQNNKYFTYPVFLFPFVIYALLLTISFYFKKFWQKNFREILNYFSGFLLVFTLFFITPFFLKMNLPEPHNFNLRKLELYAGVLYIIFITFIIISGFYLLLKEIQKEKMEKIFLFKNILIIFFIFYFFIALWLNYANQPTGDEPIYLLVAHSIVYDRDIDLKNNYERKDYRRFYLNRELESQEIEINGKLYSYHPAFYSLLIMPFYLIGGRFGVTIFTNMLASLFVGFLFLLLFEICNDKKIVFLITIFSGFTMPFIMYINQICTEILNSLLIIASFYLILFKKDKLLSICFITALIPWSHFRNLIIWLCLILIFIIENKNKIINILKFILIQIISMFFLLLFNYVHYRTFIPRQTKDEISFFEAFKFKIEGLIGLLLDQEFGLFFYTPVFIFIFAGAYFLFKENKKIFYNLLLILLPYYFFISSWTLWNGGGGASNRFLVAVFFIFIIFILPLFTKIKNKISKNIIYAAIILNFLFSFIVIAIPWFRWNKGYGENWILKLLSDISKIKFSVFYPTLWHNPQNNIFQIIFYIFLIILLNFLIIKIGSKYDRNI